MRPASAIFTNFHWIVPGEAARSAQIHWLFLGAILERHGIRSVINLRGAHPEFGWWRRERRVCEKKGVAHLNAMLDSRLLPTRAMLAGLWTAFDRAKPPLLIKCSGGQDRTSLAAALYLLRALGWDGQQAAEAQFKRFPFLHFPKAQQRWLRAFPCFARETSHGLTPHDWITSRYDPETFARWLSQRLGRSSFAGLYGG